MEVEIGFCSLTGEKSWAVNPVYSFFCWQKHFSIRMEVWLGDVEIPAAFSKSVYVSACGETQARPQYIDGLTEVTPSNPGNRNKITDCISSIQLRINWQSDFLRSIFNPLCRLVDAAQRFRAWICFSWYLCSPQLNNYFTPVGIKYLFFIYIIQVFNALLM